MSINLNLEKKSSLTAQERYDIIHFARQASEEEGFANEFLFNRALYCYAAVMLDRDNSDKIRQRLSEDLLGCGDDILKNDILSNMLKNYPTEMQLLSQEAQAGFEDYVSGAKSLRGIVDVFQNYSADIMQQATTQLQSIKNDNSLKKVIDIVDKGGMNNVEVKQDNNDTLF